MVLGFDGCEICSSDEEHLNWSCGVERAGKWNSQGHEGVLGCNKEDQRQKPVLIER